MAEEGRGDGTEISVVKRSKRSAEERKKWKKREYLGHHS